jgi:hypothetical protein
MALVAYLAIHFIAFAAMVAAWWEVKGGGRAAA